MTGLARLTLPFPQIAAGLGITSVVLAGLLWVQGQRMHSAKVERDMLRDQAKQWAIDLATQRKSIDTLKAVIQAKNDETEKRFQAFEAARVKDGKDLEAANKRAAAVQSRVKTLLAIADRAPAAGSPTVPDELLNALEGL